MQVVILAGGFGTRISEESMYKPKPMVEIGGIPILIHIMRYFYKHGFDDFIICAGYKSSYIKQYFYNYELNNSDAQFDFRNNKKIEIINNKSEKWKVTIIDSGLESQTGYRIRSVKDFIKDDFIMTYGDGLANVDLKELIKHHNSKNIVTLTAVQLEGRFGSLGIKGNQVTNFMEKQDNDGSFINGGFMVISPRIFDYIPNDKNCSFEFDVLPKLAHNNLLGYYKHTGFWKCMDTLKDKNDLEKIWKEGKSLWK